jgi:sialidase-1
MLGSLFLKMLRLRRATASILLLATFTAASDAQDSQTLPTAVTSQHVCPVLIRKDHNPLLRVRIESPGKSVFLTSFTFSLDGTDHVGDFDSLEVFSTGDSDGFATTTRFGEVTAPARAFSVRGNFRLNPGVNVFWLSCRLKPVASLDHKADASCVSIETSAGIVKPTDSTPGIRKRIGIALRQHMDDGVHTHRIAAIATTPKGTLLCVYDMRRRARRDLQEDIDIGLLRSTDGGQTWEPQRVIMDMGEYGGLPQEQNGCSDPGILVDPQTGEVFVTAVWTHGRPGTHQWNKGGSEPGFEIGVTSQFMLVRSQDDGKTWSQPENLTRSLKKEEWILFAPSPQQGIALPDGTLVMPTQGRDEQDRHFSNLTISRDHGKTWTVSPAASYGNTECQAVQLGDGSIMLNCRSESPTKFRTVAVTSDLGQKWREHETNRNTLIEPNCNGSTYRFDYSENGKSKQVLLFANPHTQTRRDHHTILVSFDDGKTWPEKHHLLLDEFLGAGYPSLTRVDDDHIGIVYEGSPANLTFERISLQELIGRE